MRLLHSAAVCLVLCLLAESSANATIVFNSWEDNTTGFFAFGAANGSLGLEDYGADHRPLVMCLRLRRFGWIVAPGPVVVRNGIQFCI